MMEDRDSDGLFGDVCIGDRLEFLEACGDDCFTLWFDNEHSVSMTWSLDDNGWVASMASHVPGFIRFEFEMVLYDRNEAAKLATFLCFVAMERQRHPRFNDYLEWSKG